MTRPPWEVADVIRIAGSRFRERYGVSLTWPQVKVLRAIARCRTAALGGHLDVCTGCGYVTGISYNSCRNRHCPKCQTGAREKWLAKRQQELLPVNYFHLVFSVPHSLVPLIWQNRKVLFTVLFEASAATLLEVAAAEVQTGSSLSGPTNVPPSDLVVGFANCRARNPVLTFEAIRPNNCTIDRCCGEFGGFARSPALPDLPPRVRSTTECEPVRKKKLVTSQ
jgi:hypothetical protein